MVRSPSPPARALTASETPDTTRPTAWRPAPSLSPLRCPCAAGPRAAAARGIARFGAGEGVDIEKPPVFAIRRGQLVQDAEQELVPVAAAAEAGEAVDAGGEREDEGVTRKLAQVLAGRVEGAREIGAEGKAHRLHVAALARGGGAGKLARSGRRGLRLAARAAHLEGACLRGMSQSEVGIGAEG